MAAQDVVTLYRCSKRTPPHDETWSAMQPAPCIGCEPAVFVRLDAATELLLGLAAEFAGLDARHCRAALLYAAAEVDRRFAAPVANQGDDD